MGEEEGGKDGRGFTAAGCGEGEGRADRPVHHKTPEAMPAPTRDLAN